MIANFHWMDFRYTRNVFSYELNGFTYTKFTAVQDQPGCAYVLSTE